MTARIVPPGLITRLLVFSPWGLAGTLSLLFGQIFGWVFVPMTDVAGLRDWQGELERGEAVVVSVSRTGSKVNKRRVYKVEFTHGDGGLGGASYSVNTQGLSAGAPVAVEYPVGHPEGARIVGMGRKPFPPWVLMPVLIPFVAGLALLGWAAHVTRGRFRLLREGNLAPGKLVAKAPTRARVNRQRVHRFTYEFTASDGRTGTAVARTHRIADLADDGETIVYDPETLRAMPIGHLPGRPRIIGDNVETTEDRSAAFAVLLIGAAVAGWVALVLVTLT